MTVLSILSRGFRPVLPSLQNFGKNTSAASGFRQFVTSVLRQSEHERRIQITPSRWAWTKYKDMFHFYILLGVIPLCGVVFLTNVFIGPATLSEIPPGYVPKQYEYHQHPISRFILKYVVQSHQEVYERNLHYLFAEDEKRKMRLMAWRVERLMRERGDYPNYFVKTAILSKYLRKIMESDVKIKDEGGYND